MAQATLKNNSEFSWEELACKQALLFGVWRQRQCRELQVEPPPHNLSHLFDFLSSKLLQQLDKSTQEDPVGIEEAVLDKGLNISVLVQDLNVWQ